MSIDINRMAGSAVDSFLNGQREQPPDRQQENENRGLGGLASLAVGAGITLAVGALFSRARRLDLEQLGHVMEDKIAR